MFVQFSYNLPDCCIDRIRRTQISFRCKQSKEDQLNDAGASIQVDETSGQHQSPGGKNDKSNDAVSPRLVL